MLLASISLLLLAQSPPAAGAACAPREQVLAWAEAVARAKETRDGNVVAGHYASPHDFADPTWATRTSRPEEMAALAGTLSRWETIRYRTAWAVVECNTAAVELEVRATYRGQPLDGEMVSFFTFDDRGRVIRQRDYFTTAKWSRRVRELDGATTPAPAPAR